jgi:hypothetical protein
MLIKHHATVGRQRPKAGTDFYSGVLRAQRPVVDVYQRAGGLGDLAGWQDSLKKWASGHKSVKHAKVGRAFWGLGDLAGQTGVTAIDNILDAAGTTLEEVKTAMKIEMALSGACLLVSLVMLYRSTR